ncbi:MAG: NPCBM/NEW2 domain-containing protein [Gemmataceae bacterium]
MVLLPLLMLIVPVGNAPAIGPAFRVLTAEGVLRVPAGELKVPELGKWLREGKPLPFVALTAENQPRPSYPQEAHLLLSNGDRIVGKLVDGDDSALRFAAVWGIKPVENPLKVPLAYVAAIWFRSPFPETSFRLENYGWLPKDRTKDLFVFENRDQREGTLRKFLMASDRLVWQPDSKPEEELSLGKVAFLAMNPALLSRRPIKGPSALVVTASGSRITLKSMTIEAGTLLGMTAFGSMVELSLLDVVHIAVRGTTADELGSIVTLPQTGLQRNGSALGHALMLAGDETVSTFETGLGLSGAVEFSVDLKQSYRIWSASVGMDVSSPEIAAARFEWQIDAKPAEGMDLRAGQAHSSFVVPVENANKLTIRVVPKGQKVGVRVNLVDAWLVRK